MCNERETSVFYRVECNDFLFQSLVLRVLFPNFLLFCFSFSLSLSFFLYFILKSLAKSWNTQWLNWIDPVDNKSPSHGNLYFTASLYRLEEMYYYYYWNDFFFYDFSSSHRFDWNRKSFHKRNKLVICIMHSHNRPGTNSSHLLTKVFTLFPIQTTENMIVRSTDCGYLMIRERNFYGFLHFLLFFVVIIIIKKFVSNLVLVIGLAQISKLWFYCTKILCRYLWCNVQCVTVLTSMI